MDELRNLKDQASRAMGRGQWKQAFKLYGDLAKAEAKEGTWPLRAGDAARKLGNHKDAIQWYERAAATYGERGFVVRAIAVGKMIESLDPGNDRILRLLDAAQKESKTKAPSHLPAVAPKPAPAPAHKPTSVPKIIKQGPPLSGRLNGPPLSPQPTAELSMHSMEIVFDDVDDGIPIQATDIIPIEDLVEVSQSEAPISEEELIERLPSFPLFQVLPKGAFLQVVSQMEYRVLEPETTVIRQGDRGTSMFAIIEGEAHVHLEDKRSTPLATLTAGDVFGEMALVLDQPRAATVQAQTELELFEMDRELFRSVLEKHEELGDVFSRMIKRRLVENVMTTAPLFQKLDEAMRRDLMYRFEVREVPANTKLVEQDTPSDGLYVILAGKIEVVADEHIAAVLSPGQTFGVTSLIDADHRSPTSFVAPVDAIVLRLPRSAFHEVISFYPPVLEHLAEVAERQQSWGESDSVPVV